MFSLDALRASPSSETLFIALSSLSSPSPTTSAIPLLSRLFGTHTHFLRRYRTALFPASQNKITNRENDMRITSMSFFVSCLKLLAGNAQSWEARVGLVNIIESERIYASQGVGEGDVQGVREDAVGVLEGEAEEEVVSLALDVLTVLARVDYDVVEPVVGRVLPRLILVSFVRLYLSLQSFHRYRTLRIPYSGSPASMFISDASFSRPAPLPPCTNRPTCFSTSFSTSTPRPAHYTPTVMHSLTPVPVFLPSDLLHHLKNSTAMHTPLLLSHTPTFPRSHKHSAHSLHLHK